MTAAESPVFRLMCRSHSLLPPTTRRIELGELFSQARANNKAKQISGLLVTSDWFVQTLEGEEATVRSLFARIEADARHDQVHTLTAESVGERVFARLSTPNPHLLVRRGRAEGRPARSRGRGARAIGSVGQSS